MRRAAPLARGLVLALLAGLLAGVVAAVLAPAPAGAHAVLLGTTPADGQVLAAQPAAVELLFNEPVRVTAVEVLDAAGMPLDTPARPVDTTVRAELPAGLAAGTYVVNWRVVSADGHPISGAFTFSVGAPGATVAQRAGDGPGAGALWWWRASQGLLYLGVLVAAGLALFRALVHRDTPTQVAWAAVAAAAAGGAMAVPAAVLVQSGQVGGWSAWRAALDVACAVLVALAALAAATAARPRWACAGAALVALATLPAVGHTRTYGPFALVAASDLLHVTAAACWLGGLVGLTVVLRAAAPPQAAAAVRRFSTLAGVLVALVGVSGLLLGWRIVGSLDALTGTGYGRVLLAKTALVAVVLAVAAYNRYRLVPGLPAVGRLRRTVAVEAVLLVCVVAVTAVLVTLNPSAPTTRPGPASATETVDGTEVALAVAPGARGANTVTVTLRGRSGAPLEPAGTPEVTARTTTVGPLRATATRRGPGQFDADLDLPLPGLWQVTATVRVSTYQSRTLTLEVLVR